MLKVGAYLRTQRERKGLSYEQIHEITRISPDVLRKIEEGRSLSAPIFLKGFVKNYARALGLDPIPLLKELEEGEETLSEFEEEDLEEYTEQHISHWERRKRSYFFVIFCLALFIGALTLFPHFSKFKSLSQNLKPEDNQILLPESLPEEEKKEDESPAFSLLDTIKREEFSQELMINPSESLDVYFKADGGSIIAKSLFPENWYVIKALEKIYLRVDKSAFFNIIHNGEWKEASAPLERTFE
ncbi:MAG: helix-turn-helix transcriptional regulator [Bdellovibrionales bacterium]|nr:helix-turn-helix transcriptional regulator [Bdellovibrionales bacterium]